MPLYTFSNSKGETRDVFFHMNDEKAYAGENGKEKDWQRVWHAPQASFDTQIDPFSKTQFSDKLGRSKGTMGDCWDRSAELSARRAEKTGHDDPVKRQYYDKAKKKLKGKECMAEMREKAAKLEVKVSL